LSHHKFADFNFAQSIGAGLILEKSNQSGVNFKETEEVAISLATEPPIGFLEIISCCSPRGSRSPILKQIAVTFQAFRLEYFEKINQNKDLPTFHYCLRQSIKSGKWCTVRVLVV
jgi:hypothetical protein